MWNMMLVVGYSVRSQIALFSWRRRGRLPHTDKMSLDGTSLGHSYSRQKIAVGKNGVFMYFFQYRDNS